MKTLESILSKPGFLKSDPILDILSEVVKNIDYGMYPRLGNFNPLVRKTQKLWTSFRINEMLEAKGDVLYFGPTERHGRPIFAYYSRKYHEVYIIVPQTDPNIDIRTMKGKNDVFCGVYCVPKKTFAFVIELRKNLNDYLYDIPTEYYDIFKSALKNSNNVHYLKRYSQADLTRYI